MSNVQEEGVSLNIPPAQGVTPAGAAKELRHLLREMYRKSVNSSGNNDKDVLLNRHNQNVDHITRSVRPGGVLYEEIQELLVISRRRRPSETRQKIEQMLGHGGSMRALAVYADQTAQYGTKLWKRINPSTNHQHLARAYELVQVLPTIEAPPSEKTETVVRAITAIIKAHHGIVEGGPELLPQALSHVIAEMMEKENPSAPAVEIWTPLKVPGGSVVSVADQLEAEMPPPPLPDPPLPVGPFVIQDGIKMTPWIKSGLYNFTSSNWEQPMGTNSHGSPEDGIPAGHVPEDEWQGGHCPWAVAAKHFTHMCAKYSGSLVIRKRNTSIIYAARPYANQPILWLWKEVSHAIEEHQEVGAGSTGIHFVFDEAGSVVNQQAAPSPVGGGDDD